MILLSSPECEEDKLSIDKMTKGWYLKTQRDEEVAVVDY